MHRIHVQVPVRLEHTNQVQALVDLRMWSSVTLVQQVSWRPNLEFFLMETDIPFLHSQPDIAITNHTYFIGSYCADSSVQPVRCASNQFSFQNSDSCLSASDCPAGYSCIAEDSVPVQCDQGYYSYAGEVQCTQCPAGSYCPDGETVTAISDSLHYAEAGSTYETLVPPGYHFIDIYTAPLECQVGTWWDVSTATCSLCQAGNYCPDPKQQEELACPSGTYTDGEGFSECQACPAGYSCNDPSVSPVECSAGQFALGYAIICTDCPSGYACPGIDSSPEMCPAGTYSDVGQQDCTPCNTDGTECVEIATSSSPGGCSSGYYRVVQEDETHPICLECPPGHACPNDDELPTPCESGYYAIGYGNTVCTAALADEAAPNPDSDKYDCPSGYKSTGSGRGCEKEDSTDAGCSAGQFAWPELHTCLTCPEGFYCPIIEAEPLQCIQGYYSTTGETECHICEAGYACPTPYQSQQITCDTGFWSVAGSVMCYPVAAGQSVPSTSQRPDKDDYCSIDEISKTGSESCSQCGYGKTCPSQNMDEISCDSARFYSRAGETSCYPIETVGGVYAQYDALDGAGAAGTDGVLDTDFAFSDPGNGDPYIRLNQISDGKIGFKGMDTSSDFDCSPGMECLFPQIQDWYQCPAGTYSEDGSRHCQPCPSGSYCPLREDTAESVRSGYFSPINLHIELVSPAGWESHNSVTNLLAPCKDGYYSDDNTQTCSQCGIGFMCPQRSNEPVRCNEGHESLSAGLSSCVPCLKGEIFNESTEECEAITVGYGQLNLHPMFDQEECPYGTYSTSVTIGAGTTVDCLPCTAGYACEGGGDDPVPTSNDQQCTYGYFCNSQDENVGALSKYPCPPGTKATSSVTPSFVNVEDACDPCDAGNYCEGANTAQAQCPGGYFCPAGTKYATQYPCPAGFYSSAGSSAPSDCIACGSGKYCPQGSEFEYDCPPWTTCTGGTRDDQMELCPDGEYPDSSDPTTCLPCDVNHYCPSGTPYPLKCPAGTKGTGSTGEKDRFEGCTICDVTEVCPRYGTSGPESDYEVTPGSGYVISEGTQFKQQRPCAWGLYDANVGESTASQICPDDYTDLNCRDSNAAGYCQPCPDGKACMLGTSDTSYSGGTAPLDCEPGFTCEMESNSFKRLGTLHTRMNPCEAGTYYASAGQTSESGCVDCDRGYYCPEGSYKMTPCPSGYYCPDDTGNYEDYPCPAGTYSIKQYLEADSDCDSCPLGHYCPQASVIPLMCPRGTYRSTVEAKCAENGSDSDCCTVCEGGSKCPYEGMTAAIDCGAGFYSPEGSQDCYVCQAGYTCSDSVGTSFSDYMDNPCEGNDCSVWDDSTNSVERYSIESCPLGYYCPSGSLFAIPCPIGTIRDTVGATDLSDCVDVTGGLYADEPGSYTSIISENLCSPGYKCGAGATSKFFEPCPPGQYQDQPGMDTCEQCPAGKFCIGATVHPLTCPAGYYCEEGQTDYKAASSVDDNSPKMCPKGTYGGAVGLTEESECTPCTAGSYCAETGAQAPTGKCDAGYLCYGSSITPRPTDGTTGEVCPTGGYCEIGSSEQKACEGGFYNPNSGGKTVFDCTLCTPGNYCQGQALDTVSGPCADGWYCGTGSTVDTQYPAEPGYYAVSGDSEQTQCVEGTYQNLWHQSSCTNCPEGFYCPGLGTTDNYTPCPVGYWCAEGVDNPTACVVGTYNPTTHATSIDDCLDCPAGKYCDTKGASAPGGDCDPGYFCITLTESSSPVQLDQNNPDDSNLARWGPCPYGHYCPQGTAYPYKCPIGYFSTSETNSAEEDCDLCTQGYYCETTGLDAVTAECEEGFYCPAGQHEPRPEAYRCTEGNYCPAGAYEETPCPSGTYMPHKYGTLCYACPRGYYCLEGAQTPTICSTGRYCPASTGTEFGLQCGLGKYQPEQGRTACLSCPPGKYCDEIGQAAPKGDCDGGYYCKGESTTATPSSSQETIGGPCEPGYFCPQGSAWPIPCKPGYACPSSLMVEADMVACDIGYYCTGGADTTAPTDGNGGALCPTGHYCPTQTAAPYPCEPGTYYPSQGLGIGLASVSAADCTACPAKQYCEGYGVDTPLYCDDGWYCEGNDQSAKPEGQICPAGYRCTGGERIACTAGYYQDKIGQTDCETCPSGYQCVLGSVSGVYDTLAECGQMMYCPVTTADPIQCPDGYYTTSYVTPLEESCYQCPAGFICHCGSGTSCVPSFDDCPGGYYCAAGTYSTTNDGTGGPQSCGVGYYCPEKTPNRIVCPPGYACTDPNLDDIPATTCDDGYYCPYGATTQTPSSLGTEGGDTCPSGHYCPAGTGEAIPCPLGSYRTNTGGFVEYDDTNGCIVCDAGYTCDSRGLTDQYASDNECAAGYYCPDQTTVEACPVGSKCPAGVTAASDCKDTEGDGHYQPNTHQSECLSCPVGFYCPTSAVAVPCPAGQYCNREVAEGTDCPLGTYMPYEGTRYESDCLPCQEGYECGETGIDESTKFMTACEEGYYCPAGTTTKLDCPKGAYCPAGAAYYTKCPVGTYGDTLNAKTQTEGCEPCDDNKFCGERGMLLANQQNCGNGFVCGLFGATGTQGAMAADPHPDQAGSLCPEGQYCITSQVGAQDCDAGTYNPDQGRYTCNNCPAGQLCETTGMQEPTDCDIGYWCPAQTNSVTNEKIECPAGTFGGVLNTNAEANCIDCPIGSYCEAGSSTVTGICDEGFFCPIGSELQNGYTEVYVAGGTSAGFCPKGHTCPAGTDAPVPCEPGTYGPYEQASACEPCPAGNYCDERAMTDRTIAVKGKVCAAGYYCLGSATIPTPTDGVTGGKCTPGNYCPEGSTAMTPCAGGTFEPRNGSNECQDCPEGFYCPEGTDTPIECASGYCPDKSEAPTLCPDGTYGSADLTRMTSSTDCPYCPNTQYCHTGIIQGTCDPGYYCDFGAVAAMDSTKICPQGHYCIAGTELPTRCPDGFYYPSTGAYKESHCEPCAAGTYCIINDSISRTCPKGHICPEETFEPTPCWKGTYNPEFGQSESSHCLPCPEGSFCDVRGIADYEDYLCPVGHYCEDEKQLFDPKPCPQGTYRNATGASNDTYDCWGCPEGHFCNEGSIFPTPCNTGYYCPVNSTREYACEAGTYCPAMSSTPTICPAGYYCPRYRTDQYLKCQNGTYCPEGSIRPIDCPAGTFGSSNTTNIDVLGACNSCGRGQFSDFGENSCRDCYPGYVCVENAITDKPQNLNEGGYPCPKGFYCPGGTYSAVACPLGTKGTKEALGFLNECEPCQPGEYGNKVGATSCQKCSPGTISDLGSSTCRCAGLNRKFLSEVGSCVCKTGFQPIDPDNDDPLSDCEKKIYDDCNGETQERDSNGACRDRNNCTAACDGGKGTVQFNGICQCQDVKTIEEICPIECVQNLPEVYFTSNGTIEIKSNKSLKTNIKFKENLLGSANCAKEDPTECKLTAVGMTDNPNGDFSGSFGIPDSIDISEKEKSEDLGLPDLTAFASERFFKGKRKKVSPEINNPFKKSRRQRKNKQQAQEQEELDIGFDWSDLPGFGRQLQDEEEEDEGARFITNPVICTTRGSALLFENLTSDKYPIYEKDSLLNTNDNFDYGEFDALSKQLSTEVVKSFVFTFDEPGIYVFADSRQTEKQLIIAIMGDGKACPTDTSFSPQTYASLIKIGAFKRDVLEPPSWLLFFAVLFSFCLLIIGAVALIAYIFKRQWKSDAVPSIGYQKKNYKSVENDDIYDKNALVSLNTESSSFLFRHQGRDEEDSDEVDNRQVIDAEVLQKPKKKKKKNRDITLSQVEDLKDNLAKHLREINKLFGKKTINQGNIFSDDDEQSSDDDNDALNRHIADLKKLVDQNAALLKGEYRPESAMSSAAQDILEPQLNDEETEQQKADRVDAERKEYQQQQKEELNKWGDEQNKKFEAQAEEKNEKAQQELDEKKNTVLQQQIISSQDMAQKFANELKKKGSKGEEVDKLMDDVKNKMENIENIMEDDKQRQAEMIKRRMDARKNRRKKMQEKLDEVQQKILDNEKQKQGEQDEVVKEIQTELMDELKELDKEDEEEKKALEDKYETEKRDKLLEYEEMLKDAKNGASFDQILQQYQSQQDVIDQSLAKQKARDTDNLDRKLKARRAQIKAAAQLRKEQEFARLEKEAEDRIAQEKADKAQLMENLKNVDAEEEADSFINKLNNELQGEDLNENMEKKKRDEAAFKEQKNRELKRVQGNDVIEERKDDEDIQNEIKRLQNGEQFDAYTDSIKQRQIIQRDLDQATNNEERDALMKKMEDLDATVRRQLENEQKSADAILQDKLAARRKKKNANLEKQRAMKSDQLQQRIARAIDNSDDYQETKNQMTQDALDKIMKDMKMNLTPEEIPAALERIVDDKHQKELEDLLLKLYEQKAVELKEEMLNMMEEKIQKQQDVRKQADDKAKGLKALLAREVDPEKKADYQKKLDDVELEKEKNLTELDAEYLQQENKITREVQKRTQDREIKNIEKLQNKQLQEKQHIFEKYLPNSLVGDMVNELNEQEKKDMEEMRKSLEAANQKKIEDMEAKEKEIQEALNADKEYLRKLAEENKELAEKEARRDRVDKYDQKKENFEQQAKEEREKIMNEFEQNFKVLGKAIDIEQEKQREALRKKREERKAALEKARLEQEQVQEEKRKKEAEEKEAERKRIEELKQRKKQLVKTLGEGQMLIMKQCYSRPLWHFNHKLQGQLRDNGEDWAWLNGDAKKDQQKTVISKLHQKISELENMVSEDAANNFFKPAEIDDDGMDAVSALDGHASSTAQSAVGGVGARQLQGFGSAAAASKVISKLRGQNFKGF